MGIKPDVLLLQETHLNGDNIINIDGYISDVLFFNNRTERHVNANKDYGGVAILFHNTVHNLYDISLVDKSYDGVIIVNLVHKVTAYNILMICGYLPPESSTWGRNAVGFYSHILSYMYQYTHCDAVYMCGDLYSKLGKMADYIPDIEDIGPRKALDGATNKHGAALRDFLLDAKCCVVNGRVTPEHDNFTCVHRGKSCVDYFIVPNDVIRTCKSLHVFTPHQLVDMYFDVSAAGADIPSIPDHSLLLLEVATGNLMCDDSVGQAHSNHATRVSSTGSLSENH